MCTHARTHVCTYVHVHVFIYDSCMYEHVYCIIHAYKCIQMQMQPRTGAANIDDDDAVQQHPLTWRGRCSRSLSSKQLISCCLVVFPIHECRLVAPGIEI